MNDGPVDDTPPLDDATTRDPRLKVLVSCFAVMIVMTNVGSITAPTMVKRSPELLLLLSSRIRHLLFAVPAGVNPFAYVAIPFVRIGAAAAVCYLLGLWYGERGMRWLDQQLGGETPATLRWLQRGVDKAAPLLVFLMPASNIVCVLVGLRKMRPRQFVACFIAGVAFRLAWVWLAARRFDDQLKTALDWIAKYQWYLVVGFMAITILQSVRRTAKQPKSSKLPKSSK